MFEYLRPYRVVLVTGPQRSGTTIAAKMISHDTEKSFWTEEQFGTTNVRRWFEIVQDYYCVVLQCPAICHVVHRAGQFSDVAIVLMRRPVEEIIASQERIGWTAREEPQELAKYGLGPIQGPIAEVKYDFWDSWQKFKVKNAYEVNYHDLSAHSLWVPAEHRKSFAPRQVAIA